MWATYQHERIDPIRDGRVFTNYTPDSIQQDKRITNNEEYRRYLVEHTEEVMRQNLETVARGNDTSFAQQVDHGPPVLFTMEDRDPKPFGYEDTITKQMYLSRTQLDQKKRRLMKEGY
jgi:hypothetical protein